MKALVREIRERDLDRTRMAVGKEDEVYAKTWSLSEVVELLF